MDIIIPDSSDVEFADGSIFTIVRFLELLPHRRCRVRGPDGLVIYILKVPEMLHRTKIWIPGQYLEAKIKLQRITGESDGVVISMLDANDISEYVRQGMWPTAFSEPRLN